MRKIFSLLAAVLFAGSMMAADATMAAGTNGYDDFTVNGKPAVKIGTGSKGGDMSVTVGAGATSLTVYAAAWKGVSGLSLNITAPEGVTITPASINLAAEENFSGSEKAFTVADESAYKFDFVISGADAGATFTFTTSIAKRFLMWSATYETAEGGETPVEPGDEPSVLQAVKDSTTWDFSKITANTANALYGNDGIRLTDESTPSKNDEVIYADYSADFMTIGEDFNKAAIAFKGEYPIRKNQYCQAGTLHFKADVAGTIVVKFSDTGSSASATAVKRYLVVNGEQTEYWTSRENNGAEAYDAQLNVVSEKIAVPAGDVTITGSSAIVVYYVTFVPEKQDEPVLTDPTNCAEAAEAALSVAANNELYNGGKEYSITGYVTSIQTAFNAQFKNITFWMADAADGGKVLEAYRAVCETAEDAPMVGDKVTVTGKLTKYGSTPEFAQGCTYVIVEKSAPATNLGAKTIAEFLELKNTKDTCILTGVVANITNTTYGNFDLCDKADTVYIYGLLTPAGESKQFESLGVAEGDTLTVLAIYGEYNGKPQVSNAIFVEVKKAPKAPAQDIEITLSSLTDPGVLIWTDAVAEDGWWQIMGGSDAYQFSISNVSTTETAGVYTVDDLDPDYSYISIYGEKDTVDVAFENGSVTVAISNEGVVTVKGTLVGSDGNNYIFDLTYKDPVAEKTVNINITNAELNDLTETYTMFGVAGEDADKNFVQFYFKSETIAGEYTEEDLNAQYSGIIVGEEVASIFSATIKVVANANGSYTVTAAVLCYNNTLYNITMTVPSDTPEGVDAVNATVKALKSIVNGQLVIEKNGVQYNANGARIR